MSDTFDRNYLSQHVRRDVQKLYQGQTEHPVVRVATQMKTYMDPRAPYRLSMEQRASLKHHPEIVRLQNVKTSLSNEVRSRYGSLLKAKGTEIHNAFERARLDLQAETRAQNEAMKLQIREEYFKTIHIKTLEQQLARSPDSKTKVNLNRNQRNICPERVRIANFFFLSSQPMTEEDLLTRRFDIVTDMAALCSLRELLVRGNPPPSFEDIEKPSEDKSDMLIDPVLSSLKVSSTHCLFCLGDNHLCYKDQTRKFSRPDSLRRHVDKVHLCHFQVNDRCPHPACNVSFGGVMQFKNHAAIVHGVKLSTNLLDPGNVRISSENSILFSSMNV